MGLRKDAMPVYGAETAVSVKNLTKYYAGNAAVRNVNIAVNRGELVILTGPSGSGKSTVLTVMEGNTKLVKPDSGEVNMFGRSITNMTDRELKAMTRGRVGIGFQEPLLDRSFTVAENVRQTSNANGAEVNNARIIELARQFGLLKKVMQEAGGLSGGEQLRVSMMRALAIHPELIFLDEPTGALDSAGKITAFQMLRDVAKSEGATVVTVTQDPEIGRHFADREFVMEDGHLVDMIPYQHETVASE